jgi:hypothetical protein
MSRPGIGIVKFSDTELAEIRQLFRERVQSAQPVQRARIPRPRSQRPPTLALHVQAIEPDDNAVLRPGELAALLGVPPSRIAHSDFPCLRTLGGHRRYRAAKERHSGHEPDHGADGQGDEHRQVAHGDSLDAVEMRR